GAFSGFGLLVKLSDIAYLGPVFLLAVCLRLRDRSNSALRVVASETASTLFYYAVPVSVFMAIDRYYQFYRFGELLTTYMTHCVPFYARIEGYPAGFPFGHDFVTGFLGPFITRNYSVFLFDPFLIVVLIYAVLKWRRMNLPQTLVLAGAVWALISLA